MKLDLSPAKPARPAPPKAATKPKRKQSKTAIKPVECVRWAVWDCDGYVHVAPDEENTREWARRELRCIDEGRVIRMKCTEIIHERKRK